MQGIFGGIPQHVVLCSTSTSNFADKGIIRSSHAFFTVMTRRNPCLENISSLTRLTTLSTCFLQV